MKKPVLIAAFVVCCAAACSNQKPEPLYGSSSSQSGYAERYPESLGSARSRFSEQEGEAKQGSQDFATYPDQLNDPSWPDVLVVVEKADEAGRSAAYVERLQEVQHVQAFFKEEKDELGRRVGGAAQYAAKQKGCEVDAYGATTHALDKAVEKQLEERLRAYNEAHRYIEDHEEELGKPNIEKLEDQADDISYTSYLVHVGVKQSKAEIEEMVQEASDVQKTLDDTIEEAQKVQADANASPGRKKAAAARLEKAQAAKSRIDSEVQQAQQAIQELDQRMDQLKKEYDEALKQLKDKIEQNAEAKPAAA
jgi:methyl-accepting chemotaxis protein